MSGSTDLKQLLTSMEPVLVTGEYVFVTVHDYTVAYALEPVCIFREAEAFTIICPYERAEAYGLSPGEIYRQITLQVHSSLQAVGFLAAVAGAFAAARIPCNAVSAFYHDHLFVPQADAERAMTVLAGFAQSPSSAAS